jgi:lipoprotein-releasing system permease protein
MPFEWFVALRFLREGRTQTVLILVGVGFGVGVMVFLSALINGLQDSLIRQTLSTQAHVVVRPVSAEARRLEEPPGKTYVAWVEKAEQRTSAIDQWSRVQADLERVPGVIGSAPTVAGSAFVHRGNATASVALRGVEPESFERIVPVTPKLVGGRFWLAGPHAVIGIELAKDLGASPGDKLRLQATTGRSDVFTVAGIFDLGNKDVNQRWVFVSIRSAQTLLDLPGKVSTIEVKVDDLFGAEQIARAIQQRTGLVADSWTQINRQLLIALKSQSSSSVMIQFFVILAVALGIASVLAVSVVQKSREIGILRATGSSVSTVTRIFLVQGGVVGLLGSLLGSGVGTVLALLFANLATNPDGSATFPVDLNPGLFARSVGVAVLVGIGAATVPARRAAKLDPAQAIRHA